MKFYRKALFLVVGFLNIFLEKELVFCTQEEHILETYGANDLSKNPDFQGGYINFGYWKNISINKEITSTQRAESSKNLYNLIFDILEINNNDLVLEVGCGRGNGCIDLLNKVIPKKIWGVDITPQQIQRAVITHGSVLKKNLRLSFKVASSSNLSFPDNSFTKIYSVEAAQCFPSMSNFAKEAYRVLKKNGSLVITAHFSTSEKGYKEVKKSIPTFKKGDRLIPIDQVRQFFKETGFVEVKTFSIGQYVFKRLDQWLMQINSVPWVRNFYQCYKKGNLDYYVLIFKKN